MLLSILTPEREVFSGEVNSIVVSAENGLMGILENHASLLASLKAGLTRFTIDSNEITYNTGPGFIEVNKNKIVLLCDYAQEPE
jgi:F-type H+-transporting ATPase subunit epsilon